MMRRWGDYRGVLLLGVIGGRRRGGRKGGRRRREREGLDKLLKIV